MYSSLRHSQSSSQSSIGAWPSSQGQVGPYGIAVVIPCYKVSKQILSVIERIGPEVTSIIVVDDSCPEKTGQLVLQRVQDPRVKVLCLPSNQGVGGAVIAGFRKAMSEGADVVIKLDGDGQMLPSYIPRLVSPILNSVCDFTKGNRFYSLDYLVGMPLVRAIGNAGLSIVNKAVSGYWDVMDPTNGYFAVHVRVLELLPLDKLEKRYFFESDLLFRLGCARAVIKEVPMPSLYADERSNMNIVNVLRTFPRKYLVRFFKRLWYNYFLRDFSVCSLMIVFGILLFLAGVSFGGWVWSVNSSRGVYTPPGTLLIVGIAIAGGGQLLLSALLYDVFNVPKNTLQSLYAIRNDLVLGHGNALQEREERSHSVAGM